MTRRPNRSADPDKDHFATLVRAARKRAGLTQEQLAKKSGVSLSMVSALEQAKVPNPSLTTILHIEAALRPHLDISAILEPAPAREELDAWLRSPTAKAMNVTESEGVVMHALCRAVYPKTNIPDDAWAQALLAVRAMFSRS